MGYICGVPSRTQEALTHKMEGDEEGVGRRGGGSTYVFSIAPIVSKLWPQLCVFQWVWRTFLRAVTERASGLVIHSQDGGNRVNSNLEVVQVGSRFTASL